MTTLNETRNIALAGQPNTGKSSLFNRLTGMNQHVGNWPGKTVEQKQGTFKYNNKTYNTVDLPGTYSLTANSSEEIISRDFIVSDEAKVIVTMIDASQLRRSMYLLSEIVGLDVPVIAVLNMIDVAEQKGINIDVEKLENELGIKVVKMVASKGTGVDDLMSCVAEAGKHPLKLKSEKLFEIYGAKHQKEYKEVLDVLSKHKFDRYTHEWLAVKILENDKEILNFVKENLNTAEYIKITELIKQGEDLQQKSASARFEWINNLFAQCVTISKAETGKRRGNFDKIATHKIWGKPLAIVIILLAFVLSMIISMPFMQVLTGSALPGIYESLSAAMSNAGVVPWLIGIVTEALLPAIVMALVMGIFVTGVSFVFGLLEDVGYMARVAYVFDGLMSRLGLHGKAVMPFITSFGCNIAGVTGTRVIDSWKQRVVAVATSFVIPCMAIWGVVGLVGSMFFGANAIWVILSLFVVAILHMKFTSWLFGKKLLKDDEYTGLIMELPPYHKPNWKTVFKGVWVKIRTVVTKAFTLIVIVSVVLWILSYSKDGNIENSIIYPIGKFVEPFSKLFGMDWRLFIAFLVSAMGKEAALGVIAILFGAGSGNSFSATMIGGAVQYTHEGIGTALSNAISAPMALGFMFAFFFNVPCMSTVIAADTELHSKKWTWTVTIYYIVSALLIGGIAYYVGLLIF